MWHDSALIVGYTAALAVFMLALSFVGGRTQTLLARRGVRVLADISYGIYLIHAILLWTISRELTPPHGDLLAKDGSLRSFLILAALVLPVSVAYGYLSARFVEQPIRRAAHRYGRRAQARRAAATQDPAAAPLASAAGARAEDSG
jgi:peptidoglycan/LPS O-acetylase OafA/YrhL